MCKTQAVDPRSKTTQPATALNDHDSQNEPSRKEDKKDWKWHSAASCFSV